MPKKITIGIVGEIAAGKTTLAKYLAQRYQAEVAGFSDSLRNILKRIYLPLTRENMQKMSEVLRDNFDNLIFSNILAKDIENKDSSILVAEGMRQPNDIVGLEKIYQDNFYIIYIDAEPHIRYQRLIKRTDKIDDQSKTWEKFQTENLQKSEQMFKKIAKKAHYLLDNNHSLEEMYSRADHIIKTIRQISSS